MNLQYKIPVFSVKTQNQPMYNPGLEEVQTILRYKEKEGRWENRLQQA
jgi:hypothetical protein